jgi:hypothetical protein
LRSLEADAAKPDAVNLVWLDAPELRRKALKLIRIAEGERLRDQHLHEAMFSSIRFDAGWNDIPDEGLAPGALGVEKPCDRSSRPCWKLMQALSP